MKRIIAIALATLTVLGLGGLAAVALSPATPAQAAAVTAPAGGVPAPLDVITVQGTGKVSLKPDTARITFGVVSQKKNAKEAMDATSAAMEKVLAALKAQSIKDEDVRTTGVNVYASYDYSGKTRELTGYEASNQVSVTVRDLAKFGELIDVVITAGANSMDGVQFVLDDDTKAYNEALKLAVKDAKAKADLLAAEISAKTGRVVRLAEGGTQSVQPMYDYRTSAAAAMAMDAKAAPISVGTMEVSASVEITYEIVK